MPAKWWYQPYDHINTFLSLEGPEKPKGFLSLKKN
jgi:hypothetical protein